MISIKTFVFNSFQENTYLLFDETKEAVIIDPGCNSRQEEEQLDQFITEKGLKPVHLLTTHCHIDHVLGNQYVVDRYQISPEAHRSDEILLKSAHVFGAAYGVQMNEAPAIGNYLDEGLVVEFGNSHLDIVHVPGHSPGSLVFYSKTEGFMIVGDVLFEGSIGRSDLPGGDFDQLIENIKSKLLSMDDQMAVFPGHGPSTTIGIERETNPFLG